MRIRQVRPEFWSDEVLAALSDGARLFYIGLWNVADDAGWLEWRPSRIGALLYPYESTKRRESNIATWTAALVGKSRIVIWDCDLHASIPTLPKHQRIAGKTTYSVRDAHRAELVALDRYQPLTDSPVEVGRVEVGRGTHEFKERLTAAGFKP